MLGLSNPMTLPYIQSSFKCQQLEGSVLFVPNACCTAVTVALFLNLCDGSLTSAALKSLVKWVMRNLIKSFSGGGGFLSGTAG